jgi:hypothetical protein
MSTTQTKWQVAQIDEIEPDDNWAPVRDRLGIRAFGVNAYRPREDGTIIGEHDEKGSGQEELYVVLDGTATFVIDGEEIPTTAGTLVYVTPESTRTAKGDATILALGGKPGEAYQGLTFGPAWSKHRESLQHYGEKRYPEARDAVLEGMKLSPDNPGLHYNFACFSVLSGDTSDEVFEHLRRSVEQFPRFRDQAPNDDDFASVRDDPRFAEAIR